MQPMYRGRANQGSKREGTRVSSYTYMDVQLIDIRSKAMSRHFESGRRIQAFQSNIQVYHIKLAKDRLLCAS